MANAANLPPLEPIPPAGTPRPRPVRHALGWPAGSVRALLALTVMGLLGLVVYLLPTLDKDTKNQIQTLYVYLWFMVFLILASFFAAHGKSIGVPQVHSASPLGL